MELKVLSENGATFVEGSATAPSDPDVITSVIEACFASNAGAALLYVNHLPPAFFDLSSRVAGDSLQKLRTYGIRLALVAPAGWEEWSSRFGEMLAEERRGRQFGVFESRTDALQWIREN